MLIQYIELLVELKINTVNCTIKDSKELSTLVRLKAQLVLQRTKKFPRVSFSFKN